MRHVDRRAFLRSLGWSAAGVTAVAGCSLNPLPVLPPRADPTAEDALAWVQALPDGRVLLRSPRQEMGQGISIAFRQIVAEELGVEVERVECLLPETDGIPVARSTVGSDSVKVYGELVARAAAALRETLRVRGGAAEGEVVNAEDWPDLRLASFGRGPKRVVGRALATDQVEAIVTGRPLFASDVRLEGMLHGAVLRPPGLGDTLVSVDARRAASVPGFVGLVRDGGLAGVLCEIPWALKPALSAVRADWGPGVRFAQADIDAAMDVDRALSLGGLEHLVQGGEVEAGQPWTVDLRLDVPMAAHAAL